MYCRAVPVEDDLRRPDYVILMHPSDFRRMRACTDFGSAIPGVSGAQVISTSLQELGQIRILQRSALAAPPRMVIHPSNLAGLREQIDQERQEAAFTVPFRTFATRLIPAVDLGEEPECEPRRPRSLWELLDDAEE